jgi:hypothetical protein
MFLSSSLTISDRKMPSIWRERHAAHDGAAEIIGSPMRAKLTPTFVEKVAAEPGAE